MKNHLILQIAFALGLLMATTPIAIADDDGHGHGRGHGRREAPEIDPASAGSALALIGGVTVLIRGRRKQS